MANGYTAENGKENRKAKIVEIRRICPNGIDARPYREIPVIEGMSEAIGAAKCIANSLQCSVIWSWQGKTQGVKQNPTLTERGYAELFLPKGNEVK